MPPLGLGEFFPCPRRQEGVFFSHRNLTADNPQSSLALPSILDKYSLVGLQQPAVPQIEPNGIKLEAEKEDCVRSTTPRSITLRLFRSDKCYLYAPVFAPCEYLLVSRQQLATKGLLRL